MIGILEKNEKGKRAWIVLIRRPHLLHFLYPGQGMMTMTMGFVFSGV